MTKAELLADLAGIYKAVFIPEPQKTNNIVTPYNVTVFEIGLSQDSKKPTGYQKTIQFYVYNEGQPDESAYYALNEPKNSSNTDVTIGTSTYEAIANLYNSTVLQQRVIAAIIAQCTVVFLESAGTSNHANRMKLVSAANVDMMNVVKRFMAAVASNATVQAQGTSVADSTLQSIIAGSWDSYASLIVA